MRKNIVVGVFLFMLLFVNISVLAIHDYDHKFDEYYGNASITDAISAIRGSSSGIINNVGVISKNNQPRKDGTNPHMGTDFYSPANTDVYPMLSGTVYFIDNTNTYQQQHVVIKSTINNVDYYFRYMHMEPESSLYVGQQVTPYNKIGKVQVQVQVLDENNEVVFEGYVPHLHIQCMDCYEWDSYSGENIGNTLKLYPFFVNNSAYNYGNDMDVITGVIIIGNSCYFNAYMRSDNWENADGKDFICQNIQMYYRVNAQNWSATQVYNLTSSNLIDSTTFLYEIDFGEINGLNIECGDCVDFYILANRNPSNGDDNTYFGATYTHAYFPMYYRHPPYFIFDDNNYEVQYITYVDANSHNWTEWIVTIQPTCTTEGTESRTCNNCGAVETRDKSILEHNMTSWATVTPSTCYTNGTERRNCARSGCSYYETNQLPLNSSNHSGGSHWETVTNPTCTTQGSERLICNGCSAVLSTQTTNPGHSMSSWYTVTTSTCYTYGSQRRDCSECSYYEISSLSLNSSNHSGGTYWETVINPTCTTQGSERQVCDGCGTVLSTQSISALNHNMGGAWEIVTNPTCTTQGSKRQICNGCGAVLSTQPIPAPGHSMPSSWSVLTPSTCCVPGTQTRTCTRSGCSYSENGSLPLNPNNHSGGSYWTVTTAATCTASGIRSQKCYGCSVVLSTQTISALGHNWGSWIYQYRYYDEDLQYYVRVYKRTCSWCGAFEYDYLE
jgi:hypothetical protein